MVTIQRLPHWEESLALYLDRVQDERFEWGQHDCALFAASAILAMTDTDPAEAFRGTYDTEAGARRALREHGSGTLLRTVKAWFGEPRHSALAKRGDLMMLDATTCGICLGEWSIFVGREESNHKPIYLKTSVCRYSFRVPF